MSTYHFVTAPISITGPATKTLLAVTSNGSKRFKVKKVGISFSGVDATYNPIEVRLVQQTSGGTFTSGTWTLNDPMGDSAVSTCKSNASAEPTTNAIIDSWLVSPAGGLWVMQWPLGDEPLSSTSGASQQIGLYLSVPASLAVACNAVGTITVEE